MRNLQLVIRTPVKEVVSEQVASVTAEDASGRFGLQGGTEPTVAAVVPSILTYRQGDTTHLVAVGSGVLSADRGQVTVSVRHAMPCESLASVRAQLWELENETRLSMQGDEEAFSHLYEVVLDSLIEEGRSR